MSAFHVVVEDLQLRLAVDEGVCGEQQILVRLLGVSFLGGLMHINLPVEDPPRPTIEDPFVKLTAGAMRLDMVDPGVVIHMLLACR